MTRSRIPLIALAAAAATVVVAVSILARPEALISAGFERALAKARPAETGRGTPGAASLAQVPALDPRHLRPSSLTSGPDLPVLGPLKVGEKVKVAAAAGSSGVLEVIGVHELPRDTSSLPGDTALVLVLLRADDEAQSIVRWLVEKPSEAVVPADTGRRAL